LSASGVVTGLFSATGTMDDCLRQPECTAAVKMVSN
jgi:hypothetical protein